MRISEPIETRGYFWLPDDPDNKVPGNLSISERGEIRVEVMGLFNELLAAVKDRLSGFVREFDRVLGVVEDGGKVTLEKCFYQPSRLGLSGGLSGSTILAQLAFVGAHFDSQEELEFSDFTFAVDGLEEWLFISGIEMEQDLDNRCGSISYGLPDEIVLSLNDGLNLKFVFSLEFPKVSFPVTRASVNQETFMQLEAKEPLHIESALSLARKLSNFLSLAIDHSVSFRSIEVAPGRALGDAEGQRTPAINVYGQFLPATDQVAPISWPRFLFRYSEVEDRLERLLVTWLKIYASLEPVLNLYFSNRSNSFQYLDVKCLHLAQGIEALHRKLHPENKVMPAKVFKVITSMLLQCCPPEQRNWLKGKLRNANEPALGQRVKEMIEPFKSWIGNSKERKRFVRMVVNTRNFYTHFTDEREGRADTSLELLDLHDRLDVLFQLNLLRLIEFGDDHIDSLLQDKDSLRMKLGASDADPTPDDS